MLDDAGSFAFLVVNLFSLRCTACVDLGLRRAEGFHSRSCKSKGSALPCRST